MNRHVVAGCLLSTGLGVWAGVLLSLGEAERRARAAYAESEQHLKKAYEHALQLEVEALKRKDGPHPIVNLEGDVEDFKEKAEAVIEDLEELTGDEVPDVPEYINHYQRALDQKGNPDKLTQPALSDSGVSYIEEEDYLEEDGHFKGQIVMVHGEHMPEFFMDGVKISDWEDRIGGSIIVDFYNLDPALPSILYVRNHQREEDYEVSREIP